MLSIFPCDYWSSVCLFRINVCLGLLSIFWLSCMSYLYILESKPLLVASFANMPSQPVSCLFVLFLLLLCKILKFDYVLFVYFYFYSIDLGDWPKKTLNLCQRMFCLYSLLWVLLCHILYLSLYTILSLCLCVVWVF